MRELVLMWRHTKMVVLVAFCAATYAALLIPFKLFPLVPGFTEVRPASALPVVFSLLFGPAAAWGTAFGNVIGDFFGTLGIGSVFGFVANFFYGLVPYRLYRTLDAGEPGAPLKWPAFVLATLGASLLCGTWVGWGVDFLGLVPFWMLAIPIWLNNTVLSLVLGPLVYRALGPRVRLWGLTYDTILPGGRHAGRMRWAPLVAFWIGVAGASLAALAFAWGGMSFFPEAARDLILLPLLLLGILGALTL